MSQKFLPCKEVATGKFTFFNGAFLSNLFATNILIYEMNSFTDNRYFKTLMHKRVNLCCLCGKQDV